MKKARLMLSALGICAVLATAFAFTAQSFNNKILYTGTSSTTCTHLLRNRIITTVTVNPLVFASIVPITYGCTQTYTTIPVDNE